VNRQQLDNEQIYRRREQRAVRRPHTACLFSELSERRTDRQTDGPMVRHHQCRSFATFLGDGGLGAQVPKNIEDLTEYQCDSIGLRLDWNYSIMLYIIIHFNSVSKAH